jgi:hypothetical protein
MPAVFILSSVTLNAQVDTGAIYGTVKDQSGAVVPGAKVTATSQDTGRSVSTVTAADGIFAFTPIKIGTYTLTAEYTGFQKLVQKDVAVEVQQRVSVDLLLHPGMVNQTIEVTGAPPALQTQDASVGQVIGSREVNDLPLNGRNYTFLAQLEAGVTSVEPAENWRGLTQSGSFVANGMTSGHNSYLLDAIDNNNDSIDFLNGAAYVALPPPDAIQEFKLQTSSFSAEFGRAGGAVVNATTKSGTNQFHGSAWEFVRNDNFDSAQFFQNAEGVKKSELRRNQFGATAGGPVYIPGVYNGKNKTFFFGDYEGTRIAQTAFHNPTIPTAAEANSGFTNFQDLLTLISSTRTDLLGRTFPTDTIFDPATTRPVTSGQVDPITDLPASGTGNVRDPFYNGGSLAGITNFTTPAQEAFLNILPAIRFDSNALKLLNLYPQANQPGAFNNYAANFSQPDSTNHFDTRIDHNFSGHDEMFGRASYSKRHTYVPGDYTGLGNDAGFAQGDMNDKAVSLALSETHSFTANTVNEVRFGYSRLNTIFLSPYANTLGIPAQFGIQGIPQVNGNGGLPQISIGGLTNLGAGMWASPNTRISNTTQFTENLTKIFGSHTLKGGFEFQALRFPYLNPQSSRGDFSFGGFTGIPSVSSGVGMGDLLLTPIPATVPSGVDYLGGPSFLFASNVAGPDEVRRYYGSYFQDDWKVTPKLTVNLGLRWELFGQIGEKYGAEANFVPGPPGGGAEFIIDAKRRNTPLSPSFTSLLAKDGIGLSYSSERGLTNTPLTNFGPRVGLAYTLTPKLVMRAAYGIFYGGFENIGGADPTLSYPFIVNMSLTSPTPTTPIIFADGQYATLERALLDLTPDPDNANFNAEGVVLQAYQKPWKTGYTQEWNFTTQYQLTTNQVVSLGYVGNTSRHQQDWDNANWTSVILPPGTDPTSYIPFPDIGWSTPYTANRGDTFYHSVQFNYERRVSQGLQVLANFTHSRCRTDFRTLVGPSEFVSNRAPTLVGFGLKGDYQFCATDLPNLVHLSGIYQIPVGKGQRFASHSSAALDHVLGGWSAQWILTLQNGFPFTVGCPISTTANFGCNALLVPGQNLYAHQGPHGIDHFLNAAAFANPPVATTVGQSDYAPLGGMATQAHGPSFDNLDFSVFKQFRTSERTHLEFRGEFFNALNHPNFTESFATLDFTDLQDFSRINATTGIARQVQMALKFYW